jgi:hypothetical protein|tara:strand:- start:1148 stop:1633 length:486 start_codon:yes stop_codon:yes gene_type:complete
MNKLIPTLGLLSLLGGCACCSSPSPESELFSDTINLTASNVGSGLLAYLERNAGRQVMLDTFLDASMARAEHQQVQAQCAVDIEAIVGQQIDGVPLALPVYDRLSELDCRRYQLVLITGPGTPYQYRSGGTGIVQVHLRGHFAVMREDANGATVFTLQALD